MSRNKKTPPTPPTTPVGSITPKQADAFVDSIAVNTQLDYTDTIYYTGWPAIEALLIASGIRHIRAGLNNDPAWYAQRLNALAAAGITMNGVTTPGETAAWISGFKQLVPSLASVEGANEWDSNGGSGWVAADQAWQALVFKAVAGSVPVIGPSLASSDGYALLGSTVNAQNYGNLHMYFSNYAPGNTGYGDTFPPYGTYGTMAFWLNLVKSNSGSQPIVITETGYQDNPSIAGFVDDVSTAKYLLRTLLLTFNAGVLRTYIYEFADEGGSGEYNYGLVNASGKAKPAYTAIKNLIGALADPGATFAPTPLSLILSGPSTLQYTLLQKRTGIYTLAVWNEVASWDVNASIVKDIAVPFTPVTITFATAPKAISASQFSSMGALVAQTVNGSGPSYVLSVGDEVSLVTITP